MKKTLFLLCLPLFLCSATEPLSSSFLHRLSVGDDISDFCPNESRTFILCSAGQEYPCFTVFVDLQLYTIAFSYGKVRALFYPSASIGGKDVLVGRTSIKEMEENFPNCTLYKEIGFGFYYNIGEYYFIIRTGISGTEFFPTAEDTIDVICKR